MREHWDFWHVSNISRDFERDWARACYLPAGAWSPVSAFRRVWALPPNHKRSLTGKEWIRDALVNKPGFPPSSTSSLSSCPWVVHINYLASPFPTLFLTSLCLSCTYNVCFLFPVPFSPLTPLPIPADNPPCDLHFCDTVPVLVVRLSLFLLFFRFRWW